MTTEQENFVIDLMVKTKSHDEWLVVVRFGLGSLLSNQGLLAEIIVNEAIREAAKISTHKASDEVAKILGELGLKLTVTTPTQQGGREG
jgi:hypothetical protein